MFKSRKNPKFARLTPIVFSLAIFGAIYCSPQRVDAQSWRKIKPLSSTCQDIKQTFSIGRCDFPVTNVETPDYRVNITFAEKSNKWKVTKGTVIKVIIVFNKSPLLRDFEVDLSEYVEEPEGDIPGTKYTNDAKGFSFTTQPFDGEEYVGSAIIYPKKQNQTKKRLKVRNYK